MQHTSLFFKKIDFWNCRLFKFWTRNFKSGKFKWKQKRISVDAGKFNITYFEFWISCSIYRKAAGISKWFFLVLILSYMILVQTNLGLKFPKNAPFLLYFRTLELCLDGMMSRLLESLVCLCHWNSLTVRLHGKTFYVCRWIVVLGLNHLWLIFDWQHQKNIMHKQAKKQRRKNDIWNTYYYITTLKIKLYSWKILVSKVIGQISDSTTARTYNL